MTPFKTKALFEKYPGLYQGRFDPPSKSSMCFGFECGDGWFDLIDRLSAEITDIDPDVRVMQVKEKFGGLRFYVDSAPDEVYELITDAEERSFSICERCGSPGKPSDCSGWIKTLCPKCRGLG